MFRRGAVYWCQDNETGKQVSFQTKDRAVAERLFFARNEAHSDSMGISAGGLYDLNTIKYTLVGSYWTTSLIGRGNHQFVSLNPSVLWQLPRALTFHSDGRWIFGIGVKVTFGPDGTQTSTSGKLRGEFKFSRLFRSSPDRAEKK